MSMKVWKTVNQRRREDCYNIDDMIADVETKKN